MSKNGVKACLYYLAAILFFFATDFTDKKSIGITLFCLAVFSCFLGVIHAEKAKDERWRE